jgi:hypothetical protein
MARQVDIWWEEGGRLKASLRWSHKRGRISFFLIPAEMAVCDRCPFMSSSICSKWRKVKPEDNKQYNPGHLCSMLWNMKGNNRFRNRERINGWQPLGPVERERKKNRKI